MRRSEVVQRWFDADTRRLFSNTVTLQAAAAAILPLNILQSIALARALGPAGLGSIAPLIALVRIASQIADIGSAQLVVIFSPRYGQSADDGRYPALLKLAALTSLASGLCASLLSIALLLVLTLFGWDGSRLLRPTLYLALAAVFADIGGLVQTILCAKQRFVAATSLRFASALLSLAVVSGTALVTRDESAVIVAYAAADVAIAATAWIVLLTVLPRRAAVALHLSKIRQLAADWPEMRRYLGWSWLSSTTMAGLSRADEFVASFVASPEAIGLYKIAKNIFQVVQGFMSAMLEAAFVDVASYWTLGAYDRLRRAVRNITVAGVGFASLAGAAIVFAGQPVIARLYGAQFADAYPLALVLAIGMWCLPFFWLHAVLRVGSKLHVLVAAEAVATAAAIAAMFGAGSFWGIVGVAVGRISFDVVFSSVGLAYAAVHRATLFGRHRDAHPLHAAHPAPLFVTAQEGVRD